ncbi:MAG: sigma-70 family RNA polymerase sigma factor [Candidatus Solibacter sp.]
MQNIDTLRTDHQLVGLARSGDKQAFGELIQRHGRRCIDLGCFFLRNRVDAEDIAQNAFLKAYEHLDQYQGDAEFSTWLGRIVANECLMLMRTRRRTRFVYLDDGPTDSKSMPVQLSGKGPDPEGELAYTQLTDVLRFEVKRIPPLLRNVMLLRDMNGLSMQDVASQLGISVSAAKSRLVRARAELRLRMVRHYNPNRGSSALSRTAAPLNRVGRHCMVQAAS